MLIKYVPINCLSFDLLRIGANTVVLTNPGRPTGIIVDLQPGRLSIKWHEYLIPNVIDDSMAIFNYKIRYINQQIFVHPNLGVTFDKCKKLNKLWLENGTKTYDDCAVQ